LRQKAALLSCEEDWLFECGIFPRLDKHEIAEVFSRSDHARGKAARLGLRFDAKGS
jgi:hypothetical protein